jgi:hypothetical protein
METGRSSAALASARELNERIKAADLDQIVRRAIMGLWTAAKHGLNITVASGANPKHPDPDMAAVLWCPIARF